MVRPVYVGDPFSSLLPPKDSTPSTPALFLSFPYSVQFPASSCPCGHDGQHAVQHLAHDGVS